MGFKMTDKLALSQEAQTKHTEIERLQLENRILKATIVGSWLDYDHAPYQMGEEEHDSLRRGLVMADDRKPADEHGGSTVYQVKEVDIQAIIDGGINDIKHFGKMCIEK